MIRIYGVYVPQDEGLSFIQAAFSRVGLAFDNRNRSLYYQLLQEQGHIPRPISSYGYQGPHRGRHIFLITDEYKSIVGGAECVPVFWHGAGRGESQVLIRDLVVLPSRRRQRVATTLLRGIMMQMQAADTWRRSDSLPFVRMRAIIMAKNTSATRLFYQCGWELMNEDIPDLYEYDLPQPAP